MDKATFRSTIHPSLKKTILMRGTWLSAIGLLPMLLGSIFLNEHTLSRWGLPIFFLGLGLITLGMIPYRRLTCLEKHPDELVLMADDTLHYYRRGQHPFTIPFTSIETIAYVENAKIYGARVNLKKRGLNAKQPPLKRQIFFPYFSKNTVEHMTDIIIDQSKDTYTIYEK